MPVYLCIWHLLKAIKQKLGQLVRARALPLIASAQRLGNGTIKSRAGNRCECACSCGRQHLTGVCVCR